MKNYLGIVLRAWGVLKPFHKDFYLQLFFISLSQAVSITLTLVISKMIDVLVSKNITLLIYVLISYIVLQTFDVIVDYIKSMHYQKKLFGSISQHTQELSFRKILSLNISQYVEDHSAIKKEIMSRGTEAIREIIENMILQITPIIIFTIFALIVTTWYAPIIGIWCVTTIIILFIWIYYFQSYFKPFVKQDRDNWIGQSKFTTEVFQHLQLIRQTGIEELSVKKFLNKRLEVINYTIFAWSKNIKHVNLRDFYLRFSQFIALLFAIFFFNKGIITVGIIYAIFHWTENLYDNLDRLSQYFRNIPTQILDIEKYFEASIDKKPLFKESGKEKYKHGVITFENVSFKYPKVTPHSAQSSDGASNVLDNISFSLLENKKTAFVGHSGSGKSTIIKLLLRAYDYDNGSIKIGDKEIRDLNAVELRRNIGYVEQHVDLLDDTLKENILLGVTKKKISDKKLEEIAKRARIDQFYHRLGEKKFETFVGERGIKLSGGERQRVGIARAIIKDPDILIFDEATSSLDTENEARVMEAIDDVSQGKTTIVIAHRLSTVRNADMIIVMDKGKVVGQGTHDELIESCAEYRNLVEHQMN